MNKSITKILSLTMLIMLIITNISFGFTLSELKGDTNNLEDAKTVGTSFIYILSIMGSALSIICMIILGVKYMTGSVEEKAEYKKTLLPYIIGAVFVFGASTVAAIVYSIFN